MYGVNQIYNNVLSCTFRERVEQKPKIIELLSENVPFFSRQKKHLTTTAIIETLLDPELDVATTQPVGVESNAVFIVDLKYLKNTKDPHQIILDQVHDYKVHPIFILLHLGIWITRSIQSSFYFI